MATTDYNRTKRCKVFRNGDSLFLGKDVVINRRKIRNLDTLLTNVTVECKTSNAVRRLVTPVGGTEIHDLDEIQDNATLVAVSNGPFKKLQYNNLDAKIFPVNRQSPRVHVMDIQPVVHSELYRKHSGRARKIPTGALTIFVYANNHEFEPARRLTYRLIHLRALHWNQILDQISEKLELLTSCKRLYKMPHQGSQGDTDTWEKITDIQQLEQGKYYVAVGAEGGGLRKLDYGQKRNFYISPKLERRLSYSAYRENRKYYSALFANRMPNKAVSENYVKPKIDVTTTSEPTMKRQNDTISYQTNRKSRASDHSTSTAAGSEHPREHVKDRSPMRGSKTSTQSKSSDHSDVYHAKQKPVKHQRNMDKVVDLDKDDSGIYKAKGSRTETQGAEEVQETKDTKVDLPIDKREAEPVTDEEEDDTSMLMLKLKQDSVQLEKIRMERRATLAASSSSSLVLNERQPSEPSSPRPRTKSIAFGTTFVKADVNTKQARPKHLMPRKSLQSESIQKLENVSASFLKIKKPTKEEKKSSTLLSVEQSSEMEVLQPAVSHESVRKGQSSSEEQSLSETNPTVSRESVRKGQSNSEEQSLSETNSTVSRESVRKGQSSSEEQSLSETNPTVSHESVRKGLSSSEEQSLSEANPTVSRESVRKGQSSSEEQSLSETNPTVSRESVRKGKSSSEAQSLSETNPTLSRESVRKGQSSSEEQSLSETNPAVSRESVRKGQSSSEEQTSDHANPSHRSVSEEGLNASRISLKRAAMSYDSGLIVSSSHKSQNALVNNSKKNIYTSESGSPPPIPLDVKDSIVVKKSQVSSRIMSVPHEDSNYESKIIFKLPKQSVDDFSNEDSEPKESEVATDSTASVKEKPSKTDSVDRGSDTSKANTSSSLAIEQSVREINKAKEATVASVGSREAMRGNKDNTTENPRATNNVTKHPRGTDHVTKNPRATDNATKNPRATGKSTKNSRGTDNATKNPRETDNASKNPRATDVTKNPRATDNATTNPRATDNATTNAEATKPTMIRRDSGEKQAVEAKDEKKKDSLEVSTLTWSSLTSSSDTDTTW